MSTETDGQPSDESVDRLEELEEQLETLDGKITRLNAKSEQVIEPQIDDAVEQSSRAHDRVDELENQVDDLEATVQNLQSKLDDLAGLADDEHSTPEARCRDIRVKMINEAEARYDPDDPNEAGTVKWFYGDALKALERDGHTSVYPAQVYRAFEQLDQADGFAYIDDHPSEDKHLRVSFEHLPRHERVNSVNNENTQASTADARNASRNTSD